MIRFNEAIDQALTESVEQYSFDKEQYTHLFDALLSFSPDINYIIDLDGRLIYANKSLTSLFGLPLSELIGKDFIDLGVLGASDLQQQLQIVIDTKVTYRREMPFAIPSGKEVI